MNRLGVHKKLEEDTAKTDDPNWPKEYSIVNDVMLIKIKMVGFGWGGLLLLGV